MEDTAIESFISRESLTKHKEHCRQLRLRYSVLEKSYPALFSASVKDMMRMKIPNAVKQCAISMKANILAHELFFSSFSCEPMRSKVLSEQYGSEAGFLYEIERLLLADEGVGFLLISCAPRGGVEISFSADIASSFFGSEPVLAIDMWEHAYFADYGFDRKRYVKAALSRLNIGKLNDFSKNG